MKYQPGDTLVQTVGDIDHIYALTAIRPYTTKSGHQSHILVWIGTCSTCGIPFETTSSRGPRYLTRTCEKHRKRPLSTNKGNASN